MIKLFTNTISVCTCKDGTGMCVWVGGLLLLLQLKWLQRIGAVKVVVKFSKYDTVCDEYYPWLRTYNFQKW